MGADFGTAENPHIDARVLIARALPLLFGVALVVALGALLFQISNAGSERDRALSSQRHSFEVVARALAVDGAIAKAEVTLGRFVMGQDPDTGRLYQSQWSDASARIAALATQVRGYPEQELQIQALRHAFSERGALLNDIALRTAYKQKSTLGRFYNSGKDPSLARINRVLAGIIARENSRLAERAEIVNLSQDRSDRLAKTWSAVGLVLLAGALGLGWAVSIALRDRRRSAAMADAEMARADTLDQAVRTRTAELATANEKLKQEAAERAEAEEHLRQLHKMEAVGQLTGGIAHDFNNMLAVVVGGLELAKRRLHEDPTQAERHLDNALLGADRAAALTRRLLAFARSEPLLPAHVDADTLIGGMTDLIDRTLGDQIKVDLLRNADGWGVWVDKHQLENAVLNLAVNARDAMEGRGQLTVSTGRATVKAREVGENPAGDYVTLSVTDTGAGMTAEVMERVFEPFFTTKPVGQGTGLGLSQIFGFVRRCKGEIKMESELGKGTTVTLYLPRHKGEAKSVRASMLPGEGAQPTIVTAENGVRILVVEDDPRVLAATLAAVRELGHVPVACDHPEKAAGLLGEDGSGIGLILSDVLMPDITGPEMVRALPERFGDIPVLFLTGYAGDVQDADMFAGHFVLRKPFTLAALSAAIAEALSAPPRIATSAAAE